VNGKNNHRRRDITVKKSKRPNQWYVVKPEDLQNIICSAKYDTAAAARDTSKIINGQTMVICVPPDAVSSSVEVKKTSVKVEDFKIEEKKC
jgi:hypothetical protein